MGYWDRHPLAGDAPLDVEDEIVAFLFPEIDWSMEANYDENEYKRRLENNLNEVMRLDISEEMQFVIPFKVAELEIRVADEVMSRKLKRMIGDGGAKSRDYEAMGKSTAANNYNNFDSPNDYASQLRDLWDDLMKGKAEFTTLRQNNGLFDKMLSPDSIEAYPVNIE